MQQHDGPFDTAVDGGSERRRRLAGSLAGGDCSWLGDEADPEALLKLTHAEGVSALLAARLDATGMHGPMHDACRQIARGLAAQELLQRTLLRRVLAQLHAAEIPVLVLKGMALRCWLYPEPYLREVSDMDLLFPSRAAAVAGAEALQTLGFVIVIAPGPFAHELLCRSADGRVDVDMHWALAGFPALTALPGFAALQASAIPLQGLGVEARGLDPAMALLHACVHRASNINARLGDRLKWLFDIHLLAGEFRSEDWQAFVQACGSARVSGLGRSGLAAAADTFGTLLPASILDTLAAQAYEDLLDANRITDWRYVNRENLRALPDWPTRVRWLWDRLFPNSGYLREAYGVDAPRPWLLWLRLRRALSRFT